MLHLSSVEHELLLQLKERCFQLSMGKPSAGVALGIYQMLEKLLRESDEQPLAERDNNENIPPAQLRAEIEAGISSLQAQLQSFATQETP